MSFLTNLGKRFNIDMPYLVKGSFWQALPQIANTFLGLATASAFANLLPKEAYGIYSYVLSIAGVLGIFTLNGMDAAVIKSVASGAEGSVVKALKKRMAWGSLGALAGAGFALYYFATGNMVFGYSFLVAALFVPFMDSLAIFYDVLRGKKLFDVDAKYGVSVQLVVAALTVLALFLTDNIAVILLAYFFAYTGTHLFFFWRVKKKFGLNNHENPEMIKYGAHLSAVKILTTAAAYLDKIVLFNYLGAVELAVYSFALAPTKKVEGLLAAISNLALPRFSARPKEEVKRLMMPKVLKFLALIIFIMFAYIIAAPWFYRFFFPQYEESIFYSQLSALNFLVIPFSLIYTYFQAHALTKIIYPYKIIANILQIVLLLILIPLYGVLGAILARIAFSLLVIPVNLIFFRRS